MKTDPKARWQGYGFYFKEGFCWSDISNENIKTRLNNGSVYDVKSMSLFSRINFISDKVLVCLINSLFIGKYLKTFINCTVSFQINDARQLPIVIPNEFQLIEFEKLFDEAYHLQLEKFKDSIDNTFHLQKLQKILDEKVLKLYGLKE